MRRPAPRASRVSAVADLTLGLAVDLGVFWLIVHAGAAPAVANAVSSLAALGMVHVLATQRGSRARVRSSTLVLLAGGYAASIAVVSLLIQVAALRFGHSPLVWKCLLVPVSLAAALAFEIVVHRALVLQSIRRPIAGALVGAALVLTLPVIGASPAAAGTPVSTTSAVDAAIDPGVRDLGDLFRRDRAILTGTVTIGGLGSSVGAGAALEHPESDAPVDYFARVLKARVDPGGMARWRVVNDSVNGSTIHDGLSRDWPVLVKQHPDVVVLTYGMNDGAPSQFDSGETYAGAMHDLVELVQEVRAAGAVPVLLTTPSPHTGRFNFDYVGGPVTPQQAPVDTSAPIREERIDGYGPVPFSTRHAAINQGMRLIAADFDVDLVDVEPAWVKAVAERGQDALYGPVEFVHPNLLGHRLSYHAAIDAWMTGALQGWPAR